MQLLATLLVNHIVKNFIKSFSQLFGFFVDKQSSQKS